MVKILGDGASSPPEPARTGALGGGERLDQATVGAVGTGSGPGERCDNAPGVLG